jgi:hypothetical protein
MWLILSSTCLGLAIFTKGFMAILLPCVAVGLLLALRQAPTRRFVWTTLAAWLIPLAVIGVAVGIFVGPENLGQLVGVHLAAQSSPAFQPTNSPATINTYLRQSIPLLILAGLGAYQIVRARAWTGLYLVGWVLLAYIGLLFNRPTWPHHELLVTVPAAVLAGIGAGVALRETWHFLRRGGRNARPQVASLLALAAMVALLYTRGPDVLKDFDLRLPNFTPPAPDTIPERQIVALMADHADETHWVFAESPMFAFQAGLLMPPPLAVLTQKRLDTGALTEAQILQVLEAYKPEIVVQSRFFLPAAREYMRRRNFARLDSTMDYRLWVQKVSP